MEGWDILERFEKFGLLVFIQYFCIYKFNDMCIKMVVFVLKDFGLGNKLYEQNMFELVNDMMKDWMKFIFQDMDRFIINLYDFVQLFD